MDILNIFANRTWQHLIGALLHTLWQGALLGLLMSLILRRIPASRHNLRYVLALGAQFGVLLVGMMTWSVLEYEPARPMVIAATAEPGRVDRPSPAGTDRKAPTRPIAAEAAAAPRGEAGAPRWVPFLAIAWLAGVALMLGRTARSVWSAAKLARGPQVSDPAIPAMIRRIGDELGIRRAIRVVDAGLDRGPAVLGVVWPTLLLPVAAMSGLPPDTVRAIILHELAHVRRHDYLVNIAQMLVESILFFNPTVWWIGRQARLEREACCDATAVRLTGRPIEYSRSLAEWAGRARGASLAAAWAGDGRAGTLLERVRRVLRPAEQPGARVSPSGLILLLLGGPLLLALLWRGTSVAVGLAAQVLSPAERIQRLEAVQAEFAPLILNPDGKGTLKGTIRTADGKAPTRLIPLTYSTRYPNGSGSIGSFVPVRGEFSVEVHVGTTWLSIDPDDYAPAAVGPFEVRAGQTIDGIAFVLENGFPGKVRVTDGRGAAVPGARVSAHLIISSIGSGGPVNGWITDGNGVATIPHAIARPYHVSVEAHGYEPLESVMLTPSAGRTSTLTVTAARPSRGVAVDPQGNPIAGAEVRVFLERKGGSIRTHGISGPLLATTDQAGRFTLDTLRDQTSYILFVGSKAGGRGISPRLKAGEEGIRVTVGPKLTINGTIRPGADDKGKSSMPATVDLTQLVQADLEHDRFLNVTTRIPVDERGHFTATNLLPCKTEIHAGGRIFDVDLDRPETSLTIDLGRSGSPRVMRRVVLRVATPDGAVPPPGLIDIYAYDAAGGRPLVDRELAIEGGRAAFDAPAPGSVTYRFHSMIGYWFRDGDARVEPGDGEQVIEIPALAAGAIAGRVLDADGKPAVTGIWISCRAVGPVPGLQGWSFVRNNLSVDARGRFFVSPLPLGASYAVIAGRGHNRQFGAAVRLDASRPTEDVTLRLAPDASAEGRVVGPDGRPLAGVPVKLELVHPTETMGWDAPKPTGADGRFRFHDLSSELDGYRAIVDATREYQPNDAALRPGGPPVEIRLERGHAIAGRVVDAKTGRPIPGVTVYAERQEWVPGRRNHYEAEARTDDQGRFRFSNLPDEPIRLNDRDGLDWETPHKTHLFDVDRPEPIEIRGTLPSWSNLRPSPPVGR